MNIYVLILLRLIHIVSGALWVGAAIFYLFFVKPSLKSIGPAGPQFMQNMAERRKYPLFMYSISTLTVLAGSALYLNSSGGFSLAWMRTGPGIGFTTGALAALVAFLVGGLGISPTSARMGAIGQKLAGSGGSPNPALLVELHALEIRLKRSETVVLWMLAIAILTMATARYWVF